MKSLSAVDLQLYIIRPTLKRYNLWSLSAENLVMGTAAQESHCGKWLHQMGGGPALGLYQMEPRTYFDIIKRVVPRFAKKCGIDIEDFSSNPEVLIYDAQLATLMCRLQYARWPEPLPAPHDIQKLARIWKSRYNTAKGKGTVNEFIGNFNGMLCRPMP